MAQEETNLFSAGTLQTFVATTFIISLLSLGIGIYNHTRTTVAVTALLEIQKAAVDKAAVGVDTTQESVTALEDRLVALEGRTHSLEDQAAKAAAAFAGTPAPPP